MSRSIWLALIVVIGAGLSLMLSCATPFAALATLAALKIGARDGALAVVLVWLANQAIGFGVLLYPLTWDCLAWGGMIGLGSVGALLIALALAPRRGRAFAISLPFVGAFAGYELILYAACWFLPSGEAAFSAAIVRQVFLGNAIALAGLFIAHQIIYAAALLVYPARPRRLVQLTGP